MANLFPKFVLIALCFALSLLTVSAVDPNEKPCSTYGGNCMVQSSCGRSSSLKSGWCPSQAWNVKCCVAYQESRCTNADGTCQRNDSPCSGTFQSGLCPTQPGNIKCCVPQSGSTGGGCSGSSCTQEIPLPSYAHAQGYGVSSLPLSKLLNYYGSNPCDRSNPFDRSKIYSSKLRNKMVLESIGPFRVTAVKPFAAALRAAMAEIKIKKPNIYPLLGSNGAFYCRYIGGSSRWSNHAFGMALDLKVGGKTDPYNNGKTFRALYEIAPIMNKHGLFWAAGYSNSEDAMHFEVSSHTFDKWVQNGDL